MNEKIDTQQMRSNLLKQMEGIKDKLNMVDEIEKMADKVIENVVMDNETNQDYSALTIVKACEAILNINPDNYLSVKEIFKIAKESKVSISDKSGTTIISQTLARLTKKDLVVDKRHGREKVYKIKKDMVKSVSSVDPIQH